jgi:nitroreductase
MRFTIHVVRRWLGALARRLESAIPHGRLARSPFLSAMYLHATGVYRFEQQAVLHGMAKYWQDIHDGDPVYRLRRNTHRIEKGLSSADRRAIFAESYIAETVDDVIAVAGRLPPPALKTNETIQWARDVLSQFFDEVMPTPVTEVARQRFYAALPGRDASVAAHAPHVYAFDPPGVDIDAFARLARQRMSVRNFSRKPVDRELIDRAVEVAIESPSACNRVPYEFRFYDDPALRKHLVGLAPGMDGWGDSAPVVCVLIGRYRAYFHPRDRHAIYIDGALAAMSFQLALVTLGLASCSVNWPQLQRLDREVKDFLELADDEKVVMLMAVGHPHPDAVVPYSGKRPMSDVRSFNRVG